jgi:hypothetical protein
MSNVIKLPTKLPTLSQLELPQAQLVGLAHDLATYMLDCTNRLMAAKNAAEFGTAVHGTADKLAEASAGWAELSRTIRESWFR